MVNLAAEELKHDKALGRNSAVNWTHGYLHARLDRDGPSFGFEKSPQRLCQKVSWRRCLRGIIGCCEWAIKFQLEIKAPL